MVATMICALVLAQGEASLTKGKADELRELFTRALDAEKDREKLVAELAAFADEYRFADLVEAVREGPEREKGIPDAGEGEKLERFGDVRTGYTFTSGGRTFRYAVDVPASYDGSRPVGLLLDPGHASAKDEDAAGKADMLGMYRRHADAAGHPDWLVARTEVLEQAGPGGLGKELADEELAATFADFLDDVTRRFAVDLDRVYVSGISQTGFWAWYLALSLGGRVAGAAPGSAVTWQTDGYLGNLVGVPVYAVHGDADTVCPVDQPRRTTAWLAQLGAPVEYEEIAGAGHDYTVWQHLVTALEWLGERPRDPYPKRVSKSVQTLANPWAAWLRIDAIEREGNGKASTKPTAGIDAEVDGQTVRLYSEGVKAVTLALASELVDLDREITIEWNGEKVFAGKVERSFETLCALALEKSDWRGTFEAALEVRAPSSYRAR